MSSLRIDETKVLKKHRIFLAGIFHRANHGTTKTKRILFQRQLLFYQSFHFQMEERVVQKKNAFKLSLANEAWYQCILITCLVWLLIRKFEDLQKVERKKIFQIFKSQSSVGNVKRIVALANMQNCWIKALETKFVIWKQWSNDQKSRKLKFTRLFGYQKLAMLANRQRSQGLQLLNQFINSQSSQQVVRKYQFNKAILFEQNLCRLIKKLQKRTTWQPLLSINQKARSKKVQLIDSIFRNNKQKQKLKEGLSLIIQKAQEFKTKKTLKFFKVMKQMINNENDKKTKCNSCRRPYETEHNLFCSICYENQIENMFSPCGHACICSQCLDQFLKNPSRKLCPICKQQITDIQQIYLAGRYQTK